MSRKLWVASVVAVSLAIVAVVADRSRSQEETPEDSPPAEAYGGEFGGQGGFGGEYGGRGGAYGGRVTPPVIDESPVSKVKKTPLLAPEKPRIWATEDPEGTERLYQMLKNDVVSSLEFPDGTSLEEVLSYLSDEHGQTFRIDTTALDELGLGPDEPVSISVKNVRLGQALRLMLEPLELTCCIDDGVFLITTEEAALNRLPVAIYDVRDLILNNDYESLSEVITALVTPDEWAENGGGEAEIRAYPQRGSFVVSQSTRVHEQLANLFASLRDVDEAPDAKPLDHRPMSKTEIEELRRSCAPKESPGGGVFAVPDTAMKPAE